MRMRFLGVTLLAAIVVAPLIECGTVPGRAVNNTLTIGYLLSWSHEWAVGPFIGSAIIVAIKEIRKRQLLPGYHIDWVHEDTWCQVGPF